jgi:hypothetical protein
MNNQNKKTSSFFSVEKSKPGIWGMYLTSLVLIAIGLIVVQVGALSKDLSSQMTSIGGVLIIVLGGALLVSSSLLGCFVFKGYKQVLSVLSLSFLIGLVVFRLLI